MAQSRLEQSMRAAFYSIRLAAWLGLTILTAWSWWRARPALRPDWSGAGVKLLESRVYRDGGPRPLTLDVYLPVSAPIPAGTSQLRPVVLAIHGGSWAGGSKNSFRNVDPWNTLVRLVQRGCVVVAIDYTLARPSAPSWPIVVDDLREAVRWVRRHAAEFNADAEQLAVIGQSSGAHLAALLGVLPDEPGPDGVSSRVQGVVSFYGPSDLARLAELRRLPHEPVRNFLGPAAAGAATVLAESSPIHHVSPDDPPMLLFHGTDDAWVPLEQSALLADALARAGVSHRLIVVPGVRHGFEAWTNEQKDFLPDLFAFLESVWNASIGAHATGTRER
jgi:acetyl esterase/lipase